MRIWLDTEFNGFQGELISIGMVAEDGQFFYAVRHATNTMDIHPWVLTNVISFLNKAPHEDYIVLWEDDTTIHHRLENFLMGYKDIEIISDWPEDIQHLCKFMITGPGMMIHTPQLKFTMDQTICGHSQIPHHALYDAIGNMEFTLTREELNKRKMNLSSEYGKFGDT